MPANIRINTIASICNILKFVDLRPSNINNLLETKYECRLCASLLADSRPIRTAYSKRNNCCRNVILSAHEKTRDVRKTHCP